MATVRFDANWQNDPEFIAGTEKILDQVSAAILADMRQGCPIDTGALLGSLDRETADGTGGKVARIGSRDQEHSTYVELGTSPHTIRSHGNYPLRNAETGETFGREVHHPGTAPQPFMRPALYRKRG